MALLVRQVNDFKTEDSEDDIKAFQRQIDGDPLIIDEFDFFCWNRLTHTLVQVSIMFYYFRFTFLIQFVSQST